MQNNLEYGSLGICKVILIMFIDMEGPAWLEAGFSHAERSLYKMKKVSWALGSIGPSLFPDCGCDVTSVYCLDFSATIDCTMYDEMD